jgi:hypothetical protein
MSSMTKIGQTLLFGPGEEGEGLFAIHEHIDLLAAALGDDIDDLETVLGSGGAGENGGERVRGLVEEVPVEIVVALAAGVIGVDG